MRTIKHNSSLIGLGLFWGLSPSLYKFLGEAGIPIAQIIVITGVGVGLGLAALQVYQYGHSGLGRRVWLYGASCAVLLNVAFAASLYFATRLPITTYAMIVSTTPFMTYAVALILGRDRLRNWRILALLTGFLGALVVILSRHGPGEDYASPLAFACFSLPLLYALYNNFAAARWPRDAGTLTVGIAESLASAAVALPFLLWPGQLVLPNDIGFGYALVVFATVMWIVERIAFFWLIKSVGPVSTMQAVYISTPGAVVIGLVLFAEQPSLWLAVSVALVMIALWFDSRARPGHAV
ncbi:MAG: DMT family transporter [Pseudomonadota bacterium]|nr:DMT family transporter [Pseudomonadota bacterium]